VSQTFSRVIVIVLDSVGVGAMPDAGDYGDAGSHTLGNIARRVTLQLPTLRSIGLSRLADLPGGEPVALPAAAYGRMAERSPGKDSVTGHWELMGLTLDRPFPVFPHGFPPEIMREFEARIGRPTIGNVVASGTRSRPRSIRQNSRKAAMSYKASSHASSAKLNQLAIRYMRSIR